MTPDICGAKTRSGRPCKKIPPAGWKRCRMHGGASPQAKAKAEERVTRARVGALLEELAIPFEDPLDGLLLEVRRSSAVVQFLTTEVDTLDSMYVTRRDVKVSQTPNADGSLSEQPREVTMKDAVPHILVRLWNEERERHARFCKMAIDAGIAERQVKVAEAQGRLLAEVVEAVLNDRTLKLTSKQKDAGRRVAARRLRALPG